MERAYSLVVLKAIDPTTRTITGTLTTPEPDRGGDVFEPLGAAYKNPLPLLLEHDRALVIGTAALDPPTADGITFTATLPTIAEPGALKTRVDTAWQEITAGLRLGVSHCFLALAEDVKHLANGGRHFLKSEIVEVSLVALPQHRSATIATVKSLATGGHVMTLSEQITALEGERTTPATRLATLAAGGLATAELRSEFDGVETTIKSLDERLARLKSAEALQGAAAQPVIVRAAAPVIVSPYSHVSVKPNVAPGAGFVRLAMCKAFGGGDSAREIAHASQWRDSTPLVEEVLKAAVAPATTGAPAWAGALVPMYQQLSSEFVELLKPATILGRLKGLYKVPPNVRIAVEGAGGAAAWVAEGKPKPLTAFNFSSITLAPYKIATIVTFTMELARSSSPDAEDLFRKKLIQTISLFMDQQFIDPTVAESPGVKPGSITNGITPVAATADAWADLAALLGRFATALIPLSQVTLIMSESNAFVLSLQKDDLGNLLFPSLSAEGGKAMGVNVIVSQTAGANVIGVAPGYILYADEGSTTIDVSREASLQMSDTPMDPADATTVYLSLFQNNMIALRAERFVSWKRVQNSAVNFLTGAAWTPAIAPPV